MHSVGGVMPCTLGCIYTQYNCESRLLHTKNMIHKPMDYLQEKFKLKLVVHNQAPVPQIALDGTIYSCLEMSTRLSSVDVAVSV